MKRERFHDERGPIRLESKTEAAERIIAAHTAKPVDLLDRGMTASFWAGVVVGVSAGLLVAHVVLLVVWWLS